MNEILSLIRSSVAHHINWGSATAQDRKIAELLMHIPPDSVRPNSNHSVLVDKGYYYKPVDKDTPLGVKLQLCNSYYRSAVYGQLGSNERYFDYWAPLPSFPEGANDAIWRITTKSS